jgi:hypothetical protein
MIAKTLLVLVCTLLLSFTDIMASSNPIPGVGIVIKRNPGSSTARTTTDKDGNFKFERLEPGTYTVEVVQAEVDKYFASTTTGVAGKKGLGEGSGDVVSTTSSRENSENKGNAGNSGMSGGIAEISISSSDEITIDGKSMKSGTVKFFNTAKGELVCTVGPDGVLSGQLRAGISTSRSNLRTK